MWSVIATVAILVWVGIALVCLWGVAEENFSVVDGVEGELAANEVGLASTRIGEQL